MLTFPAPRSRAWRVLANRMLHVLERPYISILPVKPCFSAKLSKPGSELECIAWPADEMTTIRTSSPDRASSIAGMSKADSRK